MMHTTCTLARSALAVSLMLGLGLPAWAEEGGFFEDAEYRFYQQRTLIGAWHSQLEDIYQQSYFNLQHSQRVGEWTPGANLGYFIDRDDG